MYSQDKSAGHIVKQYPDGKILNENWEPITGYNNRYFISSFGRVRSFASSTYYGENSDGTILYQRVFKGYCSCYLCMDGKVKRFLVHRLVAQHFVPNIDNKLEVNHIDGVRDNNLFSNLEWVTCQENIKAAYDTGLKTNKGEKHPNANFTNLQVKRLRILLNAGRVNVRKIATDFNVSYGTAWRAMKINYKNI